MHIDKRTLTFATIFASALFLICNSENIHVGAYAQVSENSSMITNASSNGNLTQTENTTGPNTTNVTTNAIPYVLNVTNSSDTTSQAVDQVIQAISGGQSTTFEQVIDAASSELNNQSANISTGNTSDNISSGIP
jgi:hypothetical protein